MVIVNQYLVTGIRVLVIVNYYIDHSILGAS